ncbi:hypothetical protein GCM10022255_098010 [Dactylosporangium darangshiense]|uniref:Uncharacterized protein n=1 Tax=Dactylosporangium darangshiense TaxID=579108 RepID=A0ABP8DR86_9ACTN
MGGIQRRRRRMRQHQPVTSTAPAPPEAPLTPTPSAAEPAPPTPEPEPEPEEAAAPKAVPRPSPHHLAELSGTFAMTSAVHDPEPAPAAEPHEEEPHEDHQPHHDTHHHHHHHDEVVSERGLRGLVGGGASQVSVSAAMRARDAARPSDDDIAAAERDLQIIRRGWVPREELTRPGRRSPTS